jgi:transposase-like protein
MPPIFVASALLSSVVKLACPHCRERQVRARRQESAHFRCKKCHKLFTLEEGQKAARRR